MVAFGVCFFFNRTVVNVVNSQIIFIIYIGIMHDASHVYIDCDNPLLSPVVSIEWSSVYHKQDKDHSPGTGRPDRQAE